jgi:hypothetical protein
MCDYGPDGNLSADWRSTITHTVPAVFDSIFLLLQGFVVAFLLLHDWVNLGRLNNLAAIDKLDSLPRRVFVTLLPGIPAAVGLIYCVRHFVGVYPDWLQMVLWITYGVFVAGLLRAWWIPYLLVSEPERAARYQILFAGTHTFLPYRNGISPNTLHVVLHLATVATLVMLFFRGRF